MFVATPVHTAQVPAHALATPHEQVVGWAGDYSTFALEAMPSPLQVGGAEYRFCEKLTALYDPLFRVFRVLELPFIEGGGEDENEARRDWELTFHATFQRLMLTRDFELDDSERAQKSQLVRFVDVPLYMNTTPYVLQKIGYIDQERPYPSRITWIDGQSYYIEYERVSDPSLDKMIVGEWLEAELRIDPASNQILEVLSVRGIEKPACAAEKVWENLAIYEGPSSDEEWT